MSKARLLALLAFVAHLFLSLSFGDREELLIDQGWKFHLGDIVPKAPITHHETYMSGKAGNAQGAAAKRFDDSEWRTVKVPHDWSSESAFDPQENVSQGYRQRGIAWYRRSFTLEEQDERKHLELQFDGVSSHCTVWVNGTLVHRNFDGYTSFAIDVSPYLNFGDEVNQIAVRVDASVMEGWWYEGAGIYRMVRLVKRGASHIKTDGIYADPVRLPSGGWEIPLEVELYSIADSTSRLNLQAALLDPQGKEVYHFEQSVTTEPFKDVVFRKTLRVKEPQLWGVDDPNLYTFAVSLIDGSGQRLDSAEVSCGFRTLRFDADKGFFLNDEPLKIKGVCNHQDHAGVGVAVPEALWEFRLRKLKEMGANAYRCTHNAVAKEFLDACDRIGILVMAENRHFNSSPETLGQLEWMVKRDRNHPSVIMWSVFNEEPLQGERTGREMVRCMSAAIKRLDPSRPVTAGMSDGFFEEDNIVNAVDVMGINYSQDKYDRFHQEYPDIPIISSEDTSTFMVRGEYRNDPTRNQIAAYDEQAAFWGDTHRNSWKMIDERPFIAGGFVWTGFDYHGEPQPHVWPSIASVFGCLDMCGFPKTGFYIRQAQWLEGETILKLAPHWNWSGREGELIDVMGITNAGELELFLNGRSLGRRTVDPYAMVEWRVEYEVGTLEAVAYREGREVMRERVQTTGPGTSIEMIPDRLALAGDGIDAMPITVRALDEAGLPVPTANMRVEFEIEGPGKIIGLGNGDPNSHEPEKGRRRSLFNGLAQVIVQSEVGGEGEIVLRAISNGLKHFELRIPVVAVAELPRVPLFSSL